VIQEQAIAERLTRRLRAVLFVDVVDSVRLIQQDAERTVARWREFIATVARDDLPGARGRMVKQLGDGMLLEFESVRDAVECALAMQSRIELGNAGLDPDRQIHLRMGIHVADVLADDMDLYGDGVNLAARLMVLGGPQEIVISAAVRDHLTDGLGVTIEDLGERQLKGVERPVRAFRAWPIGALPTHSPDRVRQRGDRPSIAVLPFRNLSKDPAHDFLGDLLAEDVIGHLSRLTDLFVISRLSTTPFRDRLFAPRNVAEVLGVRYVLSGSMLATGTQLQVIAELTEAEAGHVIWSERFRGSMADIFELQEALATDIAKRVVPYVRQLELQRARSKRPENLTAYERTLRAIDHFHHSSHEDLDQARVLLEAAIESDPSYVAPYAWLAHLHVRRVGQGWSDDANRDTVEARRYAAAALDRDDTDPLALTVSGLVAGYLDKDLKTSIAHYDRALAINPSASSAWVWSTSTYAWLGQGEEAVRRSLRAMELSPFDPLMYTFTSIAGTAHAVAGQYDEAIDFCRRSLRLNRMFASTHRILAISLALSGDMESAGVAGAELLRLEPGLTVGGFRARYPGNKAEHTDRFCEALAMAGVPR
jgi:TolB-like protein/class 3 adenylate cyclase/Tfp pilus assembly protein PilF